MNAKNSSVIVFIIIYENLAFLKLLFMLDSVIN